MPGPALDGEGRRTHSPQHTIDTAVYDAIRDAAIRLIRSREMRPDSVCGPVYFVLYDLESQDRARELAAALRAACTEASPHWPKPYPTPRPDQQGLEPK